MMGYRQQETKMTDTDQTTANFRASIDSGQDVIELLKDLKAAGVTSAIVDCPDAATVRAVFLTSERQLAQPVLDLWYEWD